jgi:CheY-like chemotaxis protein
VDDEEILVRTAGRMLERLGYRVTTAANAKLALERVEEDSDFELVITDLAMPGRSGLELAADLGRVRPGLPVVLVSGFIGGVDPKAITAAGFQAVVQKPLSFDNLAGLVSRVLGGAGAPAQA